MRIKCSASFVPHVFCICVSSSYRAALCHKAVELRGVVLRHGARVARCVQYVWYCCLARLYLVLPPPVHRGCGYIIIYYTAGLKVPPVLTTQPPTTPPLYLVLISCVVRESAMAAGAWCVTNVTPRAVVCGLWGANVREAGALATGSLSTQFFWTRAWALGLGLGGAGSAVSGTYLCSGALPLSSIILYYVQCLQVVHCARSGNIIATWLIMTAICSGNGR